MKTLIIGSGQVGTALKENIAPYHETFIRDLEDIQIDGVDVLHICYPDHEGFDITTKAYIAQYKPKLTIINSSVRVGTTRSCGEDVVYSPTRGRHPKLAEEMRVFVRFVASHNSRTMYMANEYFKKCGFTVFPAEKPEALELLKVLSNIHMGLEIVWRQEVERILNAFEISPKDYDEWEHTYREGYIQLKDWNLMRSLMRPDPIGGHCILPCTELLNSQYKSPLLDFIIHSNELAKRESEPNERVA